MNKVNKRKSRMLMFVGMIAIAVTQILSHYVELADLTKGLLTGIGIGMLLLVLILGSFKSTHLK